MTVQPGAEARTREAQAVLATAAAYQAEQEAERRKMVLAALAIWATLDLKNVLPSWSVGGIGTRIFVLLSSLMELMAADADGYVRQVLADQGVTRTGPRLNPITFASLASDGRDLESLLAGAVVKVRQAQRAGASDAAARLAGRNFLELVLNTQVADAARAAESAAITTADGQKGGKAVQVGWVRMLTPPSCSRCAVLAGKFYKWNSGFLRHPNCDCRHIPITLAGSSEILTNPYVYFNSLSPEEQDYYFGGPQARAIRDGADINQVVNAQKQSMFVADGGRKYSRDPGARGLRLAGQSVRPTVWQIYRDASGDQERAKALLKRWGYIL